MQNAKKRLFFALWPDDQTRRKLEVTQKATVAITGGRAVKPDNLHVTLAFLHSVSADDLNCVVQAGKAVRLPPFVASFSVISTWKQSRIVWAGQQSADNGGDSLQLLSHCLWQELASCGVQQEPRRYTPHITLARKIGKAHAEDLIPNLAWHAQDFVLVESKTGGSESDYEVLQRFPLQPPAVNSR